MSDNTSIWESLVEYARWAPSPHNIQPWKIRVVSHDRAELCYDPRRMIPDTDLTSSFTMVGIGIFVEYLTIAAAAHGYVLTVEGTWQPMDATSKEVRKLVDLQLVASVTVRPEFDQQLLLVRRTSRLPYNGQKISPAIVRELQAIAISYGHTLSVSSQPEVVVSVLRLNRDTLFYDLNDAATRDELLTWLRYSGEQAKNLKDGLWAQCMNLPGMLMYLFFHVRWLFNVWPVKAMVGRYYLSTMSGTTTIAWLTGPFEHPSDWIQAGKLLGKLWLVMAREAIYLHPFGSIITNPTSHTRFCREMAIEKPADFWSAVRLGYGKIPERSYRLPVTEILL